MMRVVVPIDSMTDAASVIPDALRLVGPDGELVLIRNPGPFPKSQRETPGDERQQGADKEQTARDIAAALRDRGVAVRVPEIHDELEDDLFTAASALGADMIVVAARDLDPRRKLAPGSKLHTTMAQSPVPILVSRPNGTRVLSHPRLLVPLDGSESAESVLPLAESLAMDWNTCLWLTQVVPVPALSASEAWARTLAYLESVARTLHCDVRVNVITGRSVPTMLIRTARDWAVTDVVLASHGHTARSHHAIGNVTERLIQHLHCRIVVVPPAAAASMRFTGSAGRDVPVLPR